MAIRAKWGNGYINQLEFVCDACLKPIGGPGEGVLVIPRPGPGSTLSTVGQYHTAAPCLVSPLLAGWADGTPRVLPVIHSLDEFVAMFRTGADRLADDVGLAGHSLDEIVAMFRTPGVAGGPRAGSASEPRDGRDPVATPDPGPSARPANGERGPLSGEPGQHPDGKHPEPNDDGSLTKGEGRTPDGPVRSAKTPSRQPRKPPGGRPRTS